MSSLPSALSGLVNARVQGGTTDGPPIELEATVQLVNDVCEVSNLHVSTQFQNPQGEIEFSVRVPYVPGNVEIRVLEANGVREPLGEAFAYASSCLETYEQLHLDYLRTLVLIRLIDDQTSPPSLSFDEQNVLEIVPGSPQSMLRAPTSPTQIYAALGLLTSNLRMAPETSEAAAIEAAFCDVFAVYYYNRLNLSAQATPEWTIAKGYVRDRPALRYLDTPQLDGGVENINEIRPGMDRYQRSGFIRKLAFNLYTGRVESGATSAESLRIVYLLFWTANNTLWHAEMTFIDLARSLTQTYVKLFGHSHPVDILDQAMRSVGLVVLATYHMYSKAGYVARLVVRYRDASGAMQELTSNAVTLFASTSISIPLGAALTASVIPQFTQGLHASRTWHDIDSYVPSDYDDHCVVIWGSTSTPRSGFGQSDCNF